MADEIKVEDQNVKRGLAQFMRNLADRSPLLKALASSMYVSIRGTFREQGVPADSWAPLAPSTIKNPASKASADRKILILSGRLLNSIQAKATPTGLEIGTNLVYARVQQEGSKDWMGGAAGPVSQSQLLIVGRTARFTPGSFKRTGMCVAANGRSQRMRLRGPADAGKMSEVAAHTRRQNIPARPYLVFRPEDPARLRNIAMEYTERTATNAGLQLGTANGGAV